MKCIDRNKIGSKSKIKISYVEFEIDENIEINAKKKPEQLILLIIVTNP